MVERPILIVQPRRRYQVAHPLRGWTSVLNAPLRQALVKIVKEKGKKGGHGITEKQAQLKFSSPTLTLGTSCKARAFCHFLGVGPRVFAANWIDASTLYQSH